jgi:hypothetical protein
MKKEITNYKSQITNNIQSQNYKLQIKDVPDGHVFYACGEKPTASFLTPPGFFLISDIVIWNLFVICILYFVIWNIIRCPGS